jgi:thiosulfate/3-mercaptopyruvate sulfurtransferase
MIDFASHSLVATEWLADHLADPDLRIVDARWYGDGTTQEHVARGRIPGAVHLDWQRDFGTTIGGIRDLLLPPEPFAALMAASGIGEKTRVVAYAHEDYSGATRLWWALRHYGHDQVAVLDGGITQWIADGRPLTTKIPSYPPATFTPRVRSEWLATADEIQAALDARDASVRLIDTRPPEQFAGRAVWTPPGSRYLEPGADAIEVGGRTPIRAGHIPGAVHLESSLNLDTQTWKYLPAEELRARAEGAGVTPDQRVITYCGVGISASLGLFALWLAGYRNVALYDASWEEWATDPSRPVER